MIHTDQKIINRLGIHARPGALIAQTAAGFTSDIQLEKDGVRVNAKSIMGIMMLAAEFGSTLRISADGSDEKQAIAALCKLFEDRFNEEF